MLEAFEEGTFIFVLSQKPSPRTSFSSLDMDAHLVAGSHLVVKRGGSLEQKAEWRDGKKYVAGVLYRAADHALLKPILPLNFSVMGATKFS